MLHESSLEMSPSQVDLISTGNNNDNADSDGSFIIQVTNFWNKVLNEAERTRLVSNIAGHLKDAKEFLQKRAVSSRREFCYENVIHRDLK